jgi:hypothetical protein
MLAETGTSGTCTRSKSPSAAVGLLLVTGVSAFAPGSGDSDTVVAQAAMLKKAAATEHCRFMEIPGVSPVSAKFIVQQLNVTHAMAVAR